MNLRDQLLDSSRIYQIVSVYNALSTKIANMYNFDWIMVGGYNTSGSWLGMPDVGLMTMMEQVEAVRRVSAYSESPIIADGDDGYGNYLNVIRLVKEMELAGANAIQLEDQMFPKKCGHFKGKHLIGQDEFVAKIKAFVDTRKSESFLLFARTDAIGVGGFQEAIDRGNAYLEAGADVIFVEAIETVEQAEKIPTLIDGPLLYNWVYKGLSPLIPLPTLKSLGYRYVLQADILYAVSFALKEYFQELKSTGSYGNSANRMLSFEEFNDLIGLREIEAAESKYDTAPIRS